MLGLENLDLWIFFHDNISRQDYFMEANIVANFGGYWNFRKIPETIQMFYKSKY